MQSIRQALIIGIALIGLVIGLAAISSAQSVSYTYDALKTGSFWWIMGMEMSSSTPMIRQEAIIHMAELKREIAKGS